MSVLKLLYRVGQAATRLRWVGTAQGMPLEGRRQIQTTQVIEQALAVVEDQRELEVEAALASPVPRVSLQSKAATLTTRLSVPPRKALSSSLAVGRGLTPGAKQAL